MSIFIKNKTKRFISAALCASMITSFGIASMPVQAEEMNSDGIGYASTRERIEAEYTPTDNVTDWSDSTQKNYQIADGATDENYFIKSVEWTDREKGEAKITIAGNSTEPAVALYVFTTCFHGVSSLSRQRVVEKDIKALANAYDRVDVIVIDGPDEWAVLQDNKDYYGGIHEVKSFDRSNASDAYSWINNEAHKWSGAHYTGNVPAAIRKYLFGSIDADISEDNLKHNPAAIYVSADMHYLTNYQYYDNRVEASTLSEYATAEYFQYMTDHYLGDTKRYFSSSQTGKNDSTKSLLVKRFSVYDAEYMKIVAAVFNPNLYSEGANMVKPWSGMAPDADVTPFALTNSKFSSDYNYKDDIMSAGMLLPNKQLALSDSISDKYEIVDVKAYTQSGMMTNVTVDGQNITARAESFLSGDEITMEVNVRLKGGIGSKFEAPESPDGNTYFLDGSTKYMTVGDCELMPETENVNVKVSLEDDNNRDGIRPEEVEIYLKGSDGSTYPYVISRDDVAEIKIEHLLKYNSGEKVSYHVEAGSINGYKVHTEEVTVDDSGNVIVPAVITHKPATKSIRITKHWDDNDNVDGKRPDSIKVTLIGSDGSYFSNRLYANNGWTLIVDNLYAYYDQGKEMEYWLEETSVDGYESKFNVDEAGDFNLTNIHTQEMRDICASIDWNDDDNRDGVRPVSQKVTLNGSDGKEYTAELNEDNNWSYIFKDVAVNYNGKAVTYTLSETVPSMYKGVVSISDNPKGFVVTNTHEIETTDIAVSQTWSDEDNRDGIRPDKVKVTLRGSDGSERDLKLYAGNNWSTSFKNLPVYFDNGKKIVYKLAETVVTGYATDTKYQDGVYNITNMHTPVKKDICVHKKWDDSNNADGLRKDVELTLTGSDGSAFTGKISKNAVDQEYIFKDLYVYANGQEIASTINETAMEGYTAVIKEAKDGFTITNVHKASDRPKDTDDNADEWDGDDTDPSIIEKLIDIPKTGDDFKMIVFGAIAVMALLAGVGTGIYTAEKKRK